MIPYRLQIRPRAQPEKLKATGALGAPSGRFCLAALARERNFQIRFVQGFDKLAFYGFLRHPARDGDLVHEKLPGAVQHLLLAE